MMKGICIFMLSDDDFSEVTCTIILLYGIVHSSFEADIKKLENLFQAREK